MCIFGFAGTRRRTLLLLVPFLSFVSCFSQSGESTPPPPAHLPRLLWECEAGAGFGSCSLWIWHGSSYSAIWSNGAVGQLTVQSGNAAELQVHRTDTSGPVAGVSATYTGKWNGTSVTDGKLAFTLKGASGSGAWTGKPALTPVVFDTRGIQDLSHVNPLNYFKYLNWYSADLTGFAFYSHWKSEPITPFIDDYRVRGERPMKPGEGRQRSLRAIPGAPNFEKGAVYTHTEAIAAIYSDGSTFGDSNVLAAMTDYRRSMIASLTSIGTTLCTLGTQQTPVASIAMALDKQHAEEDTRSAAGKDERDAAYRYIEKKLASNANTRLPGGQAVKLTLDLLNQLRSGLAADPVKNSSGQLAIPPPASLTCNLP